MCVVLLVVLIPKYKKLTKEIKLVKEKRIKELESKINSIMPTLDIVEIEESTYKIFYEVQIGWMNFDYDKLKELLSDELYNTYVMDLDVIKLKNQKNVMKDFELVYCELIDIKEENNNYIIKVQLEVKFYDYIEDISSHKVLRGTSKRKLDNTYILTFERTKCETKHSICPQCGAPVEGNATGICEFCKSKLVNDNYNWVMSKKEKIDQR